MFNLYYMSGKCQEIKYTNFLDLTNKLNNILIEYYYSPNYIRIIFNEKIINNADNKNFNFYAINNLIEEDLQKNNDATVILSKKNTLYFVQDPDDANDLIVNPICYNDIWLSNGISKRISNTDQMDHYIILLAIIFQYYDNAYEIIMNYSYRNLIIMAIAKSKQVIENITEEMRNDEIIALYIIKHNSEDLKYINKNILNYREIVLQAVKQDG